MQSKDTGAFLTDQAVAILDASDQIKNIRAAQASIIGITSLFKYTAIGTCTGAIASLPLVLAAGWVSKYVLIPPIPTVAGFLSATAGGLATGIVLGIINFRRDRKNYNKVLVRTVMKETSLSQSEADLCLRQGDHKAAKAFNNFMRHEPTQYLTDEKVRRKYQENREKLRYLRAQPYLGGIRLANGTWVGSERFML